MIARNYERMQSLNCIENVTGVSLVFKQTLFLMYVAVKDKTTTNPS